MCKGPFLRFKSLHVQNCYYYNERSTHQHFDNFDSCSNRDVDIYNSSVTETPGRSSYYRCSSCNCIAAESSFYTVIDPIMWHCICVICLFKCLCLLKHSAKYYYHKRNSNIGKDNLYVVVVLRNSEKVPDSYAYRDRLLPYNSPRYHFPRHSDNNNNTSPDSCAAEH